MQFARTIREIKSSHLISLSKQLLPPQAQTKDEQLIVNTQTPLPLTSQSEYLKAPQTEIVPSEQSKPIPTSDRKGLTSFHFFFDISFVLV